MDGWIIYMWEALELPTGKEEKKRPPYYGNWFFIPFEKLYMSLITFKIDNETRVIIDWMQDVKNSKTPNPEALKKALNKISTICNVNDCNLNPPLIEILDFKNVKKQFRHHSY